MIHHSRLFPLALPLILLLQTCAGGPARGSDPLNHVRQPKDLVGFTHSAAGIAKVVAKAGAAEGGHAKELAEKFGFNRRTALCGAISPHDDHAYASRVYVHPYPYLKARHVVLIGVAHGAKKFPESTGKLVFDSFSHWHGPYADIPVSNLRQELLRHLEPSAVLVNDEMHREEHSLEAMLPFLQHFNRKVSVLPILVPYMSWDRLYTLARKSGNALNQIMEERGLVLGRDVAILISADTVHYGDEGWGKRNFAEFGADGAGYDKAVARDRGLIADHLTGLVNRTGLRAFYNKVVDKDFHKYKITWCGRFSIPFGLATLSRLTTLQGLGAPKGMLLRYGTTLDPGRSDPGVPDLGVTAPANIHHWVGFTAIGYTAGE